MKYTVYDASQYIKVGETDSELEALKMRDHFLDGSNSSDCVIEDEEGNFFDLDWDLAIFVNEIIDHSDNPDELQPMTPKEALKTLMEWFRDGVEIPEDMTPEILAYYWNDALENMKVAKAAEIEARDDKFAAQAPYLLRLRKAYEDGGSAFFDPDQLDRDLLNARYDEVHRKVIIDALKAFIG